MGDFQSYILDAVMATSSTLKNLIVGWGIPRQLRLDVLPTYGDLVDHFFYLEGVKQPALSINDILKAIC